MEATPRYVTVHEAAQSLAVSCDTIRRWEKKGLIRSIRSKNNYRRFSLTELERLHEKHRGKAKENRYRILATQARTEFRVVELFSGCGGLALGLHNAGLETELLVEIEQDPCLTLQQNRPGWNVEKKDVAEVDFRPLRGKVDVVTGGFPCQAFSYAGQGLGFADQRGILFFEFARAVKEIQPRVAIGENVRGLEKHDGGKTLKRMIAVLADLGYEASYQILRAQFLDVPQKRERLILVVTPSAASMRHYYPEERNYTISVREALENCPDSAGATYPEKKREIMKLVPEGGYWRDLPPAVQRRYMMGSFKLSGGKTGMARRLAWDEPSLTLTCNPAQKQTERCHPSETRPFTVREYARLQCFPDDWSFAGSVSSQYEQIGNAVPVNLGYHIGRAAIATLLQRKEEGYSDRDPRSKEVSTSQDCLPFA